MALMHETGLAGALSEQDRRDCEQLIQVRFFPPPWACMLKISSLFQAMVLATDISRQAEFLRTLGHYVDNGLVDMRQSLYRHFMLQIALKCADISNPCRTWNISRLWSYRACEEFYRQGDRERELNLPVTPFFDRNGISVAKVRLFSIFDFESTNDAEESRN